MKEPIKDTKIKKGEVRNPNGRPKGSTNKATAQLRDVVKNLVEKEFENVETLLAQLEPRERAKFLIDLMKYVLPSLSSINMEATVDQKVTQIEVKYKTKED